MFFTRIPSKPASLNNPYSTVIPTVSAPPSNPPPNPTTIYSFHEDMLLNPPRLPTTIPVPEFFVEPLPIQHPTPSDHSPSPAATPTPPGSTTPISIPSQTYPSPVTTTAAPDQSSPPVPTIAKTIRPRQLFQEPVIPEAFNPTTRTPTTP
jgi:hypothetical protein